MTSGARASGAPDDRHAFRPQTLDHLVHLGDREREELQADKRLRELGEANRFLPVLFCSPTMELGVDIAALNAVHMRNVPPTPANYAQRSGRSGRSGQAALVITYASSQSPHDQYFFRDPRAMVHGEVRAPLLDLANRDLIDSHLQAGDLVAVVTATNEFVTRPIASAFGVDHLLAVELERDDNGRVTGRAHGVPTFREGKVVRVEAWLQGLGHQWGDFDDVLFYSDSTNDLPLLERVPTPIATNPTPALEAIARERGWRILKLFEPS